MPGVTVLASSTAVTCTPASASPAAAGSSKGPDPATTTRRPVTTPCPFSNACAAPTVVTPGNSHPGNGSTISLAPVATTMARTSS